MAIQAELHLPFTTYSEQWRIGDPALLLAWVTKAGKINIFLDKGYFIPGFIYLAVESSQLLQDFGL